VADLERLRRRDLAATMRQLANARADVVGVVVNRSAAEVQAYPTAGNGAGALARQLAEGSRATLRRIPTERLASLIRRNEPRD
jgi:Mrp family chromosome partitioning ATPase